MHKIFYPLTFLALSASCSDKTQISDNVDIKNAEVQNELKNEREFVVGNFRDSKIKDTVFVELIDSKTLKYVPSKLDTDWETNLEMLVKRDTKLTFSINGKSYLISDYEQSVGASLLENLGDLNGDGLDEIGFVEYSVDFSTLNSYYIYHFSNGTLTEALSFGIRDEMLEEKEPFVTKIDNKTISCRIYDSELENERGYKEYKFALAK